MGGAPARAGPHVGFHAREGSEQQVGEHAPDQQDGKRPFTNAEAATLLGRIPDQPLADVIRFASSPAADTFALTVSDDQGGTTTRTLTFTVGGDDNVIAGTSGRDLIFGDVAAG